MGNVMLMSFGMNVSLKNIKFSRKRERHITFSPGSAHALLAPTPLKTAFALAI